MRTLRSLLYLGIVLVSAVLSVSAQSDDPIIIIPGLTGSELINHRTGEVVWFKFPRSKDDDLRLPIKADPTIARDSLVPGDIIRKVKVGIFPIVDAYDGLIKSLIKNGGYHEESWGRSSANGYKRAIYVFPYDWRLDNVGNARLLVRKIAQLKLRLRRPHLKFNIIAHSMGGIIARYAAMYGDMDLPAKSKTPKPNWAGSRFLNKVVLLGTPNGGSIRSLSSLVNGFAIGGLNVHLPWIQNLTKFDVFTIPSAFQLLPAEENFHALDESLQPMSIDLYDPKEWTKYGWNAINDKKFDKNFTAVERRAAAAYLAASLDRAKRLHAALDAGAEPPAGANISLIGGECKDSLDAIVLYRDPKSGEWTTLFKPAGFTRENGVKVSPEDLKAAMYVPGDGVVTWRSLVTAFAPAANGPKTDPVNVSICEEHNKLPSNPEIQTKILAIFANAK